MEKALLGKFFDRKVGSRLTITVNSESLKHVADFAAGNVHVSATILYNDYKAPIPERGGVGELMVGAYLLARVLHEDNPAPIFEGTITIDAIDMGTMEEWWVAALRSAGLDPLARAYQHGVGSNCA